MPFLGLICKKDFRWRFLVLFCTNFCNNEVPSTTVKKLIQSISFCGEEYPTTSRTSSVMILLAPSHKSQSPRWVRTFVVGDGVEDLADLLGGADRHADGVGGGERVDAHHGVHLSVYELLQHSPGRLELKKYMP